MRSALLYGSMAAALVAACSDTSSTPAPPAPTAAAPVDPAAIQPAAPVGEATPAAATTLTFEPPTDPQAVEVNTAALNPATKAGRDPALVRAQVLLARARFSPGVIDGQKGDNLRNALAAYETAQGLPSDGRLDDAVWRKLTGADPAPAVIAYTITAEDIAGPFTPNIPTDDYRAMSKLERLGYANPVEALAEKFHMDEALLKGLNPTADFSRAGERILVAAVADTPLPAAVATIEVDKSARQVRALDAGGQVVATYPATVGSTDRPAPTGEAKVKGVAKDPVYTYDPSKLTFGDKSLGKLSIKPGPNNPVGAVWIDLDIPTYGIHGAPDPRLVGKVASHGCVRLTNWDARGLAAAVKPGVKVVFVGQERDGRRAAART